MLTMTFWTLTTRVGGEIDTTLLRTEKEACDMVIENILAPAYDYEGPATAEAIHEFIARESDEGDDVQIIKHTVAL